MKRVILGVLMLGLWIPGLHAAGEKLVTRAVMETLEIAAKKSGKTLSAGTRRHWSKVLARSAAKYGDDILPMVRKGGFEVLEQGAKHGDDFWRLCKAAPSGARALALHADDLMPLARRIGPDVLKLEAHAPGLSLRAAQEFGDDGVRLLASVPSEDAVRLIGYAGKADTPAIKKLLLESYRTSKNPTVFLKHLDWKVIMATGLSAAAITGSYKVSNGIEEGVKTLSETHPEVARDVISDTLSPFRYGLYALFCVLLLPLGIKLGRWSLKHGKEMQAESEKKAEQ